MITQQLQKALSPKPSEERYQRALPPPKPAVLPNAQKGVSKAANTIDESESSKLARATVICYRCHEPGHYARKCTRSASVREVVEEEIKEDCMYEEEDQHTEN